MEPTHPRQLVGWLAWASYSPYSPLNLSHLRQPIPKDAPADLPPGTFTFQDAFEDLLAVTSGHRLPDIRTKYEHRNLLRQVYRDREDASFWVLRMHSQRLLNNTNLAPAHTRQLWDDNVWHGVRRGFDHHRLDEKGHEAWGQTVTPSEGQDSRRRGLFEELDELFHDVEERLARGVPQNASADEQTEENVNAGPDTYDELFSTVQSAVSQGASSLSTLIKTARDRWEESQAMVSETKANQGAAAPGSKLERVESKEEYTDAFGNKHVKRTVKTFNQNGQEVGREVHVRIQNFKESGPDVNQLDRASRDETGREVQCKKHTHEDEGSGWFWK